MEYNYQEQNAEIKKYNKETGKSEDAEKEELFENHAYLVFGYDVPENKNMIEVETDQ